MKERKHGIQADTGDFIYTNDSDSLIERRCEG